MRSSQSRIALVLVNALLLAILPPAKEAHALNLPKPIQAIEASLKKTPKTSTVTKVEATLVAPEVPSPCYKNCQLSEAGYALIRLFEGYSPYPYRDAVGLWTIGYGHLILPGEKFTGSLTPLQGQQLLVRDAESKVRAVNSLVNVSLNRNQFAALTSFTFNLGTGTLKTSTLLKKVNARLHSEVPPQINRFVYAGGKKLRGLVTRRLAEANLYAEPVTVSQNTAN